MKKRKCKLNIKKFIPLIVILIIVISILIYLNGKHNQPLNATENQIATNAEITDEEPQEEIEGNYKNEEEEQQDSILNKKLQSGKFLSDSGLPVLMYHFFYNENTSKGKDGNWLEISKFEEQIKYLVENDFYFPTWQEVEDYIDEKQELPEKSVVITVDDGDPSFFELAVPILQKYNVTATSFVITYWYGDRANDKQKNVSYQSHSYDMHKAGKNGKGVMLSWDYDKIKEDVLLSQEVLGGANIFCYPFGHYNELDIKVLQDTGYKMAFTTENGRVKKGAQKYSLPRERIGGNISLSEFINKVN